MFELELSRWHKMWLARPWQVRVDHKTGMLELHGVRGYLVPGDVTYLFNLAAALPKGGNSLEVGSWLGLSSIVFANGLIASLNFRATIFCVDSWLGSPEHQSLPEVQDGELFARFGHNIREAQVDGLIQPVRGKSTEVASAWGGPELDMIFIDGDHAAEACYQDIRHWHARLRKGGRLLGHDATPGGTVEQALRRYCAETGLRASVCPLPHSHFIWELHAEGGAIPSRHELLPGD
jgi:predicted O-methyltransferase YrrM